MQQQQSREWFFYEPTGCFLSCVILIVVFVALAYLATPTYWSSSSTSSCTIALSGTPGAPGASLYNAQLSTIYNSNNADAMAELADEATQAQLLLTNTTFSAYFKEAMRRVGVEALVGIPGTSSLFVWQQFAYDFAVNPSATPRVKAIMARDERNAGFMAVGSSQASARLLNQTPRLIMAMATTGPGTTNLATPVTAAAHNNHFAMFAVNTGDVGAGGGFDQNLNQQVQGVAPELVLGGVAKQLIRLLPEDVASGAVVDVMLNAIRAAASAPAGPLVWVITNNVSLAEVPSALWPRLNEFSTVLGAGMVPDEVVVAADPITGANTPQALQWQQAFNSTNSDRISSVAQVTSKLQGVKRVLAIVGVGVALADVSTVTGLLSQARVPYTLTLPRYDFADPTDPYFVGRVGHTGSYQANMAFDAAEAVLFIGTSMNQYAVSAAPSLQCPNATAAVVLVNTNPWLYANTERVTDFVVQDAAAFVTQWLPEGEVVYNTGAWLQQIQAWRAYGDAMLATCLGVGYLPQYPNVFASVDALATEKATTSTIIYVTDAGTHQPMAASMVPWTGGQGKVLLTDHKMGTVGNGLGTAIGAALTNPDATVVLFSGDMGAVFTSTEWLTLSEAQTLSNLWIVVFDNGGAGLINEEAHENNLPPLMYMNGYRYQMDWLKLAAATRVAGNLVQMNSYVGNAARYLFASRLLVALVAFEAGYSPMTTVGQPMSQMKWHCVNPEYSMLNADRAFVYSAYN